ncbi:MAG: molybdenum cofactor biosynthesis protein MoaE [Pseudomonadota bacterium]
MRLRVAVQADSFDVGDEAAMVHADDPAIGAVVTFTGYVRDEGGRLAALELEHFPGMAESQLRTLASEAGGRWPLAATTIIHRHGMLKPGEPIVLVVTASAHRRAAFEAADFLMDYLKTQAPFWKKQHPVGPHAEAAWVEAKASDDADADRWR